ncbi:MAG: L-lactate dehydrogenase [Clostridiales bacterium GWF2_36_10]|nr:MAG: L-lactate dehydrogenase [Clostridiales bacterium GWF2_36_10]HAN21798.1 L-lactate dehydrogenase [Clostridiales bacterium]
MRKKITILGAGNVGATIAYTLSLKGLCSEIVLIDINKDKSTGEALDIVHGTPFGNPVKIFSGDYEDAANSNIVIVTLGIARKPGQTRLDLAQINVNIVKSVIPEVKKYAPDAVYLVVSNPVDIITYTLIKSCGLSEKQVIGSGTMLDTARLRSMLGDKLHMNYKNIHAYVFGEHGDSSMVPWSLTSAIGLEIHTGFDYLSDLDGVSFNCDEIEKEVKASGAKVIACKGATYYGVALSVAQLVECINQDLNTCVTVSGMINNRYGINDVCLSLPFVIGIKGIRREVTPPLTTEEEEKLRASAQVLKDLIAKLDI